MKWQTCQYAPLKPDCCDVGAVAGVVQQVHDQLFDVLSEGVDGDNVDERFIVAGGGLSWTWPRSNTGGWDKTKPKGLTTEFGYDKNDAYFKTKGNATTGLPKGMEIIVDPRDPNGRVCVVAKSDTTKQIGSFIPEDPVAVANPKFTVYGNYGKAVFGTSGAFNWELHRNGAASMSDDGTAIGTTRELLRLGSLSSSASYPALKRIGAAIRARLANDTADVALHASDFQSLDSLDNATSSLNADGLALSGEASIDFSVDASNVGDSELRLEKTAAGRLMLTDPRTSADPMLQLGGASDQFPALKAPSGGDLQVRLADDSGYANIDAKGYYREGVNLNSIYQPLDSDLTAIAALTTTAHGRGLLDDADAAASRTSLALGTIATQNANSVTISGGSVTGITDLTVADGGTGASTASGARTNLGIGTIATQDANTVAITGGTIDGATLGDVRLGKTTQTAANAGNYNVAATAATVFVDANALTGGQNYDVTLPSAVTCSGRVITVKIVGTPGAGGSTVTVKSSAGTVEAAAAGTGVPLDASARSKVTYQSDGADWWSV